MNDLINGEKVTSGEFGTMSPRIANAAVQGMLDFFYKESSQTDNSPYTFGYAKLPAWVIKQFEENGMHPIPDQALRQWGREDDIKVGEIACWPHKPILNPPLY